MIWATTQPPRERTAADAGLSEHLLSLGSSLAGYLRARLELAGLEGKEAAAIYGKIAGLVAIALGLLAFGYVFFWIGAVALIAHYAKLPWGWIVLAIGVLHLAGTALCGWAAATLWGKPVFTSTLQEFKKDQEWLSSPKQTASRN